MKEYNIAEYTTDGDRNSYDFLKIEQVILTNVLSFDKIVGLFFFKQRILREEEDDMAP